MAGYVLLQVLLVGVAFGPFVTQAQDAIYYPSAVHFPTDHAISNIGSDTRANHAQPPAPPTRRPEIRTTSTPSCARDSSGLFAPCERDDEYNDNVKDLVNQLLRENPSINEIVTDDTLRVILNDSSVPSFPIGGPTIRNRFAAESPVCNAEEQLITPKRAKTVKDDWVFVVNQDNVQQALRVERCLNEGSRCNLGVASSTDISTVCRQKYVYRRMLIVGTNNIEPEEVLMPSCCVCYKVTNTFDIASRFGNGTDDQAPPTTPVQTPPPPQADPISFGFDGNNSPMASPNAGRPPVVNHHANWNGPIHHDRSNRSPVYRFNSGPHPHLISANYNPYLHRPGRR